MSTFVIYNKKKNKFEVSRRKQTLKRAEGNKTKNKKSIREKINKT